ncbi:iron chaperone [Cellulomonas sp. P5_C5]
MTTTDDYIATFPDDVRPILTEVAEALRRALPGAEERIRYGMPAFMLDDRYALHFAGWKHHVGLYPVAPLEAGLEAEVAPYRAAKDTVKLLYKDPVPTALVERIAVALRAQHP